MQPDLVEVEQWIQSLGDLEFSAFLARLIYELTLGSRVVYALTKESSETVAALIAINQLQHLVSSQLMTVIGRSGDRISAAELVARFYQVPELAPIFQNEAASAFFTALDSVRT